MKRNHVWAWIWLAGAVFVAGAGIPACSEFDSAVVERVAEVEHEQWMAWSKNVAGEVSDERRARWAKYWVPYKDLPDDVKELDREWARKALRAAKR
jgi:Zn ribbon nucleic-acid-binding protein